MLTCKGVAESLVGWMITDRPNAWGPAQGAGPRHTACALNNSTSAWDESMRSAGMGRVVNILNLLWYNHVLKTSRMNVG